MKITSSFARLLSVRNLIALATFVGAVSAQAGTWTEQSLVLTPASAADASTGIDPSLVYTHAVDFASDDGGAVINGVTLTAGGATGPNYTLTGAANTFQNNGSGQGNNLDPASGIFDVTEDFFFNGTPGPGVLTLTLTGLTGGTNYIASFYTAGFTGAQQILSADDPGATSLTTDRGDEKVISYSYTLGPGDTDIVFTFDAVNDTDFFHHYGFTNAVVPEPTSVALLTLGAIGLVALRRRRQKQQ